MVNNLKLRIHIAPVGFEVDRIVIPAKKMRADKVWLIGHSNLSVDKARPFLEKINSTTEKYCSSLNKTKNFIDSKGGFFMHFLQPSIYTKSSLSAYEKQIIKNNQLFLPNIDIAYKKTYPVMESCLSKLKFSKNLSSCFDSVDTSPYLDGSHVTEIGNKIIAYHIFRAIMER